MCSGCLEAKCFSCNRPCRKEIISTALLRSYRRAQCVNAFPPFPFSIFPPRSAPYLTRLDSDEADKGEGLETRVHRAFRNLSEFQKRCEAPGTTRLFFRVKFLVQLSAFWSKQRLHIWNMENPLKNLFIFYFDRIFWIWRNRVYIFFVLGNVFHTQVIFLLGVNDFYIFLFFYPSFLTMFSLTIQFFASMTVGLLYATAIQSEFTTPTSWDIRIYFRSQLSELRCSISDSVSYDLRRKSRTHKPI